MRGTREPRKIGLKIKHARDATLQIVPNECRKCVLEDAF